MIESKLIYDFQRPSFVTHPVCSCWYICIFHDSASLSCGSTSDPLVEKYLWHWLQFYNFNNNKWWLLCKWTFFYPNLLNKMCTFLMFHKTIIGWTVDMALVAVIYLRRKELRPSCCCSVFIARLADSDNPSYFGDFSNYSQCQGQSVFAFVFVFVFVIDLYLQNCLLYITSILANSQTHPNVRVNALFYCEFLYFKYFAFEALQMSVVMRCARLAVSNNCAFLGGAHQMPAFGSCHCIILPSWPLAQSRGNCASS